MVALVRERDMTVTATPIPASALRATPRELGLLPLLLQRVLLYDFAIPAQLLPWDSTFPLAAASAVARGEICGPE
jgi:hypothetical protein